MKRLLIALGVLFMLALVAAGYVAYRVLHSFPSMPRGMSTARVVTGDGLFTKTRFYVAPELGLVTDIHQQPDGGFVLVGELGAAYLNGEGRLDHEIHYPRCTSTVVSVNVGSGAFLCRGSWNHGTTLIDAEGAPLWSYNGESAGVDDAAAGELGDGKKIVVGLNGGGGVHLFSADGKELWKQEDGNVWHVEIVQSENAPGNIILHSNAKGQLTARDANGAVLARYTPEVYLAQFSLVSWIDDTTVNKLIAVNENSLYVVTTQGKTVARLSVPINSGIADPMGTRVDFSAGAPYFVALLSHNLWSRSLLYVWDSQKQLVYQEILDRNCGSLLPVSRDDHASNLLLGCDGVIWQYSLHR